MENKLGKVISNLRKEKGITQKDLADALNISDKAISRWERGTSRPTLEMMFQISKYFNISYNDLITARISDDHEDDKIVEEIISEFSDLGKKNAKRIKFILLFSVAIILILTIAIIFTNTYNRFKVYKVHSESDVINKIDGLYVETNIRDTLYLGDITLKDVEIKDTDIVSVDIYYIENDKEYIIYNYSSLNNLYLESYQSYIKIKNLSDYFENMYLRVSITDNKNEVTTYETKLEFILDFTNNKVYYNDNFITEDLNRSITNYNELDIKEILLENGYKETNDNILWKADNGAIVNYIIDISTISYNYKKESISYRYRYMLENNILEVSVFDESSTEIQNYKYDVANNKMNCITGSCNDYKSVLKTLDENVLYLFE